MLRVAEEAVLTPGRAESPVTPRRFRTLRTACAVLAISPALAVLFSCATVPQRAPSEWLGALSPGATLYASLSVPGSADFIKKSLKDAGPGLQDVSTLVDRSKRIVLSVTLVPGSAARFSAVALGSYPSGIIGARLGGNKDWKKASSAAGTWWEWSKAGIQLSIPNNGILLVSNGDVEGLLGRWSVPPALVVPPDVADDMRTGDFVVYMPELPGGIPDNAARNNVHVPIQEVWLKGARTAGGYTISGTANTSSERDARVLVLAVRLGIVAWMRSENVPDVSTRLKAITAAANGVQVKLAGLAVSDAEVVPLLASLFKGLSPQETQPPAETPADNSAGTPSDGSTGAAPGDTSQGDASQGDASQGATQ
jgi:hypothetical protein